ncbi:MAG: 50S ribosomal protein L29 [Rickettsiales bacterium]|nr:50S ribosomal protein L29 [Rickettsiales bacterium]|tara:strand:- start:952 stop:1146 length:195 start_codon:yes stop_codon:yes gene_type:complete
MKAEDLKGKTSDELREMHGYLKKELFNLRFQKATGELNNTARFNEVRKDIARVLTAMNQQKKAA